LLYFPDIPSIAPLIKERVILFHWMKIIKETSLKNEAVFSFFIQAVGDTVGDELFRQ
jgi:hypothetical protein